MSVFCGMESLEGRRMMSATLMGTTFKDITGNGESFDDQRVSGVTVNLFKDVNANGKLDAGDGKAVASTTSKLLGLYSFSKVEAGTYFVQEVQPSGSVRTGPELDTNIKVTVAADSKLVSGLNFTNYYTTFDRNAVKDISYLINGKTVVTSLAGNVHEGDTVRVTFTLTSTQTVSLVSYKATSPDGHPLSDQTIYDQATATLKAGTYCLEVKVPNCYFQVDFVGGKPIDKFGELAGNIYYTRQQRIIDFANGGTHVCTQCDDDNDDKGCDRDKDKDKDKWCVPHKDDCFHGVFQWNKKCFVAKTC